MEHQRFCHKKSDKCLLCAEDYGDGNVGDDKTTKCSTIESSKR